MGQALADLLEDEMEIGMGQHGEGGGGRQKLKTADETAVIMVDALLSDLSVKPGEKVIRNRGKLLRTSRLALQFSSTGRSSNIKSACKSSPL